MPGVGQGRYGLRAAQRRASAAPLAGVWSVEDGGRRQVPGKVRAADLWSAKYLGPPEAPEGCALPWCQQAVALCRVNRAQPTARASGVSCTPWLGCFVNTASENYLGQAINCYFITVYLFN